MSTSRYLNWSRPSSGRHHPLRKQMSCLEPFSGRSLSVNNLASTGTAAADFSTFVTAAIIHTNRFQSFQQAYQRAVSCDTSGGGGPPTATLSRRPASASARMAKKVNTHDGGGRKVLTKQLSLDGCGGPPPGHAWTTPAAATSRVSTTAGNAGLPERNDTSQQQQPHGIAKSTSAVKKRPPGLVAKNECVLRG